MELEIKRSVLIAQPKVFSLYEEYDGIVYGEDDKGSIIRTHNGGWGRISFDNFEQGSFQKGSELKVKIIDFHPGGEMELIPTESTLKKFYLSSPSHKGTVELISDKAILLSFDNGLKTGLYAPGKKIDIRWQSLTPGRQVMCKAYQTRSGFFVNGLIALFGEDGNLLNNFDPKTFNEGKANGSAEAYQKVKLGHLYSAIVQPSRTLLSNNGMVIDVAYPKGRHPEEFSKIIVRITHLDASRGTVKASYVDTIK